LPLPRILTLRLLIAILTGSAADPGFPRAVERISVTG